MVFLIRGGVIAKIVPNPDEGVAPPVSPETHPVPEHPVGHTAKENVHGVLDHDVDFVLVGNASRFQQTESRLHRKYDEGAG